MAYTPTNWQTGDTITAEKLNKLEDGVAQSGSTLVNIDISEFSQMTAQERCDLFDNCIAALKSGIPVSVFAYGYTTFANSFYYTETDGNIASGAIGFLGTASVPSYGSASLNAAVVKKENDDVTFSVAPITIGS